MLLASAGSWHLLDYEIKTCPVSGVKTLFLQHIAIQVYIPPMCLSQSRTCKGPNMNLSDPGDVGIGACPPCWKCQPTLSSLESKNHTQSFKTMD